MCKSVAGHTFNVFLAVSQLVLYYIKNKVSYVIKPHTKSQCQVTNTTLLLNIITH